MQLVAVDQDQIPQFTEEFTRRHTGWLVTIEERVPSLSEDDLELHLPAEEVPFHSLRWEGEPRRFVVACGDDFEHELRYGIEHPMTVTHGAGESGEDVEVRIVHPDGAATRLHMRPA